MQLAANMNDSPISPIEDILEDARNGKPYILVDAEDRENEGDIIIPAQFATPDQINFMARYARGLICLAITADRARQLRLPPMAAENRESMGTAFTVSIEAKEGVTTGISAADRARTVQVAADPARSADDIVSPGHVFPLVARDGGVLVRTGHTEAAVDISRMAGLTPAGVICEIMNDDGSMARMPDLVAFAQLHGLKIGTIADLIAYRRRTERYVERVMDTPFESIHGGPFRLMLYRNTIEGAEHVALVHGKIEPGKPTLVRMHQVDFAADLLGHVEARQSYIPKALKVISDHPGAGVTVFLRDPDLHGLAERLAGVEKPVAVDRSIRNYGVGAQILLDLGVRDMIVMSSTRPNPAALEGYGLRIVGWRDMDGEDQS
ncbi:MAG: 3,4-dihydroxy-2-butanone-4-phosphate synthase [Alphaproteobacteria bacterium]|jgi:3,4-dihydroxy 2-butanone 4-phosphate synthase / GTP cyclohydrolase II|nr:3,4-dihydroxy-2-butanone-4-phosphate synthase [Alphaproteobacteria bacterium]MBU2042372.1 3,4-dihydroxy-2-butanone-4-phosphate synthase [Alphaproteobacteria bacterium]MBU2125549.1 3,4-dihydroxy-2-butanone-4-phosphate synthase [Alphaproteobacteria bacterium]